jgi:hypothetical protein
LFLFVAFKNLRLQIKTSDDFDPFGVFVLLAAFKNLRLPIKTSDDFKIPIGILGFKG